MKNRGRSRSPVFIITCTLLALTAIGIVHVWVERATSEPPNYSQIEDGLYMGGYVKKPPRRTTAVLNLCETKDPYECEVHRWAPIVDNEPAPSLAWLREMVEFVRTQREAGRIVYVHCLAGVSRSGMIVVACFMLKNRWTRDEALAYVRTKRPGARPNPAFMRLLAEWEQDVQPKVEKPPQPNR
jgi:Dual specificity phosphatase, catalytic domain